MDCSIIIPNYNGRNVLDDCLDALFQLSVSHHIEREIIVVDNGSTDDSLRFIEDNYPAVKVRKLPRNTGFTGAIHAGVQQATGRVLVFLNNDTRADFLWLEHLLAPLNSPKVAAVGSVLLNADESQIDFAGATANLFGWGFQQGHGVPASSLTEQTLRPQFFLCGGAMAIRREAWEQTGGFDPDYFAFFEDVDLGWRLNLAGYTCLLNPASRVAHQQSFTAKQMPRSLRAFLTERNALATMVKNLSDANLAELLPWALGLGLERALIDLGLERDRLFAGRWGDEVFSRTAKSGAEVLVDEISDLKEASKRTVKEVLRGEGNQHERGQARLLALEAVLADWPKWLGKRAAVQATRQVGDRQLMPLMEDLVRAPLGHPREQAILTGLSQWLARRAG